MTWKVVMLWALLGTAPVLPQTVQHEPQVKNGELVWFSIASTKDQIFKTFGQPVITAAFGADFESWQYRLGTVDHDDFSHQIVFRKSNQTLVSITRNFDPERNVDAWFPVATTTTHHYPNPQKPEFSVRVRRLKDDGVLIAMGCSKPGQPTGQIMLIRISELKHFLPWLYEQLQATK